MTEVLTAPLKAFWEAMKKPSGTETTREADPMCARAGKRKRRWPRTAARELNGVHVGRV